MSWPTVRIAGTSFASCAAGLALRRRGVPVVFEGFSSAQSDSSHWIVLDEIAIGLVRDQFGVEVFHGAHQLRVRVVKWDAEQRGVFQPAIAMRRLVLLERMERVIRAAGCRPDASRSGVDWSLCASREAISVPRSETRYGRRVTLCCEVVLASIGDPTRSCVEVIESAWLYFFPIGENRACLQVTVPDSPGLSPDRCMADIVQACRLLRDVKAAIATPVAVQDSAPAIYRPLAGSGWLGIGSAAIRFDPLCGDGTAQSIRTGLLAAASIMLAVSRDVPAQAIQHYSQRVEGTLSAHLRACSAFYGTGNFGAVWQEELSRIEAAARTSAVVDMSELDFAFRDGVLVDAR